MTAARDVIAYIETRNLPDAAEMKLCKLAYYAQAWNIAWEGRPLFDDRIEAWKYGPVPAECWAERRYGPQPAPQPLTPAAREVVDSIVDFYGQMSGPQLAKLSHAEGPWKDARGDLPEDARSGEEITVASMRRFYTLEALSGGKVPRRPSRHVPMSTERVLALAESEAPRWQGTLARLADR
jgi:uncharacterized phage-associated protein